MTALQSTLSRLRLVLLAVLLSAWMIAPAGAQRPPNVVVFIADDAGWRDSAPYGGAAVKTPNIARLAREGVLFERAFLTSPQCSPSRVSLLSGQYPSQTASEDLHTAMPEGTPSLMSALKQAGYFIGGMQKTHIGAYAEAQFDWYDPGLDKLDAFLAEARDKPFFMWVASTDPHRPYGGADGAPQVHDPTSVRVPAHLVDTARTRRDLANYYDEIARFDATIGRHVALLKERGLYDDTIVIILSDNGAPFPREKGTLYDAGIRTPLIFAGGAIGGGGKRIPDLTSVIDLAPTILDFAGVTAPSTMVGQSMRPVLDGQSRPGPHFIFAQRDWHDSDEFLRAVRDERFKLIWTGDYQALPLSVPADASGSPSWFDLVQRREADRLTPAQRLLFRAPRPAIELYDLEADPDEYRNLAFEPAMRPRIEAMLKVLHAWRERIHDWEPYQRRRRDHTDRVTGIRFQDTIPPLTEEPPVENQGARSQ